MAHLGHHNSSKAPTKIHSPPSLVLFGNYKPKIPKLPTKFPQFPATISTNFRK